MEIDLDEHLKQININNPKDTKNYNCDKCQKLVKKIKYSLETQMLRYGHNTNWYSLYNEVTLCNCSSDEVLFTYMKVIDWSDAVKQCKRIPEYILDSSFDYIQKSEYNWQMIKYCKTLSEFQVLSEKFMNKHKTKLNWEILSKFQKMSSEFIYKHEFRVSWPNISYKQKMSRIFISTNRNSLNWKGVSYNPNLWKLENLDFEDGSANELKNIIYFRCTELSLVCEIIFKYMNI